MKMAELTPERNTHTFKPFLDYIPVSFISKRAHKAEMLVYLHQCNIFDTALTSVQRNFDVMCLLGCNSADQVKMQLKGGI